MIQQTSMNAFFGMHKKIGRKQRFVLEAIKKNGPINNLGLSRILNIPINQVTPRVLELRQLEMVRLYGAAPDPVTKRNNLWWVA